MAYTRQAARFSSACLSVIYNCLEDLFKVKHFPINFESSGDENLGTVGKPGYYLTQTYRVVRATEHASTKFHREIRAARVSKRASGRSAGIGVAALHKNENRTTCSYGVIGHSFAVRRYFSGTL